MAAINTPNFLGLPAELRNYIYRLVVLQDEPIKISIDTKEYHHLTPEPPGLRTVCRQIRQETYKIYYEENNFCITDTTITTPGAVARFEQLCEQANIMSITAAYRDCFLRIKPEWSRFRIDDNRSITVTGSPVNATTFNIVCTCGFQTVLDRARQLQETMRLETHTVDFLTTTSSRNKEIFDALRVWAQFASADSRSRCQVCRDADFNGKQRKRIRKLNAILARRGNSLGDLYQLEELEEFGLA